MSPEMVQSMPPELLTGSPRRVYDAAQALGLPIKVCMMAQSTKTADEAASACGCQVGQIVKSLIFRGRLSGKAMLFLVAGDNRLGENLAASFVGEELERPDGRFVREATGFAIGGIPPFGHATPLATIMDEDLLDHEVVWAAAGAPTAVFSIAPDRLREAARARVARIKA